MDRSFTSILSVLVSALLLAACSNGIELEPGNATDTRQPTAPNVESNRHIDLGRTRQAISQTFAGEVEPNATSGTASALTIAGDGTATVRATIAPDADLDFFSFPGTAGEKVYLAVMTALSAAGTTDTVMTLYDTDGATLIEEDDDDGSFSTTSSSIAGAILPSTGTYYVRVKAFSATSMVRPYTLHLAKRSGAATAETEPNEGAPAQAIPASKFVSGALSADSDIDAFDVTLAAGDTLIASLDLDPERDATDWNGALTLSSSSFGGGTVIASSGATAGIDSEALFMTVKDAGTYQLRVITGAAGQFGTYQLSVVVHAKAADPAGSTCTTYSSTNVPQTIPTGPGSIPSTLTVPGGAGRIATLEVAVDLTHNFMTDVDLALTSPEGHEVGLFSDVGSTAAGSNTALNVVFDDTAALPINYTTNNAVTGMRLAPENTFGLFLFDGQAASGTWTLTAYDDNATEGGTINNWSIRVCTLPATSCPAGASQVTLLDADFEAGDEGFTHSGTADEWERGVPTAAPITTCASGTSCWKTDLDATYEFSSNQTLLSSTVDLSDVIAPVWASWMQKYQLEGSEYESFVVTGQEAGGANPTTLWQWNGFDMQQTFGAGNIVEAAGWGLHRGRLDSLVGGDAELTFNLTSDTSVNRTGVAIDDVVVTACHYECGDGELYNAGLGGTEECDDGNTTNGDGCSDTCQDETVTSTDAGSDAGTDAGDSGTTPADAGAAAGSANNGGSPNDASAGGGAANNGDDASAGNPSGGSPFGGGGVPNGGADAGAVVTPAAGDDGGCGCKVAGSQRQSPWQSLLLAGLALSLAARRRRR